MPSLIKIQREADLLSEEDRAGLVTHLLASFSTPPLGANDDEVVRRDLEMDSGRVTPIRLDEFLSQTGRE